MAEEAAEAVSEPTTEAAAEVRTFTQEQVNDLIAREKGKIQSKFADYGDLKAAADRLAEIEQANASELEKAQGKLSKAEQAAASAEAKLLRYEVANDKEVPAKLVPLLTATTKEDLEAQADLILENAKPANPDFDGGTREPTPDPLTPEQQHSKLLLQMAGIEPQ